MGRYTQQKLRVLPLATVPVDGSGASPSPPPAAAPAPGPTQRPPRPPVVVVAQARAAPLVASPPRRMGALQVQPAAQRGSDGDREALKRAREENSAREAERVALVRELAQMRAEKERLERALDETRRDCDRLVAENTQLQKHAHAQAQAQAQQTLRRQASDLYPTQQSQHAPQATLRQQTWPLVMRRLLLAEQALHADARRCRTCRGPAHQHQDQQQLGQEGDAARGSLAPFPRRSLSPMPAGAASTGADTAAADERERTAALFTDTVRALCSENASCARALPMLDSMVATAAEGSDVPRRAEVALRIATILVDSCDYCRAAVVEGFTQAIPRQPSTAATTAKTDRDHTSSSVPVGQHAATSSLLAHTVRNADSWIRGTDPAPPLTGAALRFLCTTLPCCTDDGLRASTALLQSPGVQELLRHARGSPSTGPGSDVLALVRVFLRVSAVRAQPATGRRTAPSLVDRLCLLLDGRHRARAGTGAGVAAGCWVPQGGDVPASEDAEAVLRLQHSVVRFLLTALSSYSWSQWGSDGTSTATSSVPGTAHNTTLPLPSPPRAQQQAQQAPQTQQAPPQAPRPAGALLTYNYDTLVSCAVSLLNATITRFGAELPARAAFVCDLCDLLCLCSCNEDAFAAGYASLVEQESFQSTVSKLDKCVAPFRTRHPMLAMRARRLADIVTQHASRLASSQQAQDQAPQDGEMN